MLLNEVLLSYLLIICLVVQICLELLSLLRTYLSYLVYCVLIYCFFGDFHRKHTV